MIWKPTEKELVNFPGEFVEWIDSINSGFNNKSSYTPYEYYCKEVEKWLKEKETYEDAFDKYNFVKEEKDRILANSLYFIEKYLHFKDDKSNTGSLKYKAYEAQKILCFLVDCGYNLIIGKGRQIFFTTTMGGICVKWLNFQRSHFTKFITTDEKKGMEIFEDKIKFPFSKMENWMKCTVVNDAQRQLRVARKEKKGSITGVDSKLQVSAPVISTVNGGSPSKVLIDEADDIPVLSELINEIFPTLIGFNPVTQQQELKRQLIVWTAGADQNNSKPFETEYKASLSRWNDRDFSNAIVPIFFDVHARPGMNDEVYNSQKRFYYQKSETSGHKKYIIQFHKHYPKTIEDLFLSSHETIVPVDVINRHLDRIYKKRIKPKKGYFEAIYDINKPLGEGSFIPYVPIGANFIPVKDFDKRATAVMYAERNKDWINRYYRGTDPIFSTSGHSKMGSAIFDCVEGSISCIVNSKSMDYRYDYFQAILMGIYYGNVPDLVETNVGKEYINLVDSCSYYWTLLTNKMLPPYLQTKNTTEPVGINKKRDNAIFIVNKLSELLDMHQEKIDCDIFWHQLKTFTRRTRPDGQTVYNVADARFYYDDIIDAVNYSYICWLAHSHILPFEKTENSGKRHVKRYICNKDTNWNTVLTDVVL